MKPRFLASAFASGPALLILVCLILQLGSFDAGEKQIRRWRRSSPTRWPSASSLSAWNYLQCFTAEFRSICIIFSTSSRTARPRQPFRPDVASAMLAFGALALLVIPPPSAGMRSGWPWPASPFCFALDRKRSGPGHHRLYSISAGSDHRIFPDRTGNHDHFGRLGGGIFSSHGLYKIFVMCAAATDGSPAARRLTK